VVALDNMRDVVGATLVAAPYNVLERVSRLKWGFSTTA
jgi:hypothetical protein